MYYTRKTMFPFVLISMAAILDFRNGESASKAAMLPIFVIRHACLHAASAFELY
jgi:hypothetical protein